jgi:hypothetical protein
VILGRWRCLLIDSSSGSGDDVLVPYGHVDNEAT